MLRKFKGFNLELVKELIVNWLLDEDVSCRPANVESDGNDMEGRKRDNTEVGC